MNKKLFIGAVLVSAALFAYDVFNRKRENKMMNEANPDENSIDEYSENEETQEKIKNKNHNENCVRVNNSLINIKIKLFSK